MTDPFDRGRVCPRSLVRWSRIPAMLVCATIVLGGLLARSQTTPAPGPIGDERPVVLPLARQVDFRAKSGLEYRIYIAAPEGPAPRRGFPVLYLADANINFPVVLAAVRKQSRESLPAVVVGIGYPTDNQREQVARRAIDLTPATSADWQKTAPGAMREFKTGGNDRFLDFIESELKPYIESRHPINRDRQALFGHSFGGLFTLHVLFKRPECFQFYLASSPSLWWNDSSILDEAKAFLDAQGDGRGVRASVLISVGESERKPTTPERAAIGQSGTAEELGSRLSAADIPGFHALFRAFPEEDHGSVVLPAASRGAQLLLESERGKGKTP